MTVCLTDLILVNTGYVIISFISSETMYTHTLFTLCKFTEEKFGQAEKTELDAHLENLLAKADTTKHWTERIMKQTEVLLQPNLSKSSGVHKIRPGGHARQNSNSLIVSTVVAVNAAALT